MTRLAVPIFHALHWKNNNLDPNIHAEDVCSDIRSIDFSHVFVDQIDKVSYTKIFSKICIFCFFIVLFKVKVYLCKLNEDWRPPNLSELTPY